MQPSTASCETTTVVISPGVYLSNLSSSDLYVAQVSRELSISEEPTCVPSGQSKPLPWTWHKIGPSGPRVALGLSRQGCAQALQSLHCSAWFRAGNATAAGAGPLQQQLDTQSKAGAEGSHSTEPAAASSLAESFVSFLQAPAGEKSAAALDAQRPARLADDSPGIINLIQHQGHRTLIVLRGENGQVSSSVLTFANNTCSAPHFGCVHQPFSRLLTTSQTTVLFSLLQCKLTSHPIEREIPDQS